MQEGLPLSRVFFALVVVVGDDVVVAVAVDVVAVDVVVFHGT